MLGIVKVLAKLFGRSPKPKPPPKVPKPRLKPSHRGCKSGCPKPNPYQGMPKDKLEKAKKSYENLIGVHKKKRDDYKRNPVAFDNKRLLRKARTPQMITQLLVCKISCLGQSSGRLHLM